MTDETTTPPAPAAVDLGDPKTYPSTWPWPSEGGSYVRDPETGELTKLD